MNRPAAKPAPPSDDRRWDSINAIMRSHGYAPSALIETLHAVQKTFGFISKTAQNYVAQSLDLPPSTVYSVSTFYDFFKQSPPGAHTLTVCTGTTCHVKGSAEILKFLKDEYELENGCTTTDGRVSLYTARCLGACSLAPVIVIDGEIIGQLNVKDMKAKIREWFKDDE